MVQYEDADAAKEALNSVRGTYVANSKRLMVRLEVTVQIGGSHKQGEETVGSNRSSLFVLLDGLCQP